MAYRRKSRRSRYGNRRRGKRSTYAPNKWAWYAKQAWKGVKFVKSIINSEKHYFDNTSVTGAVASAGTIYCLSNIAQGDDVNNRQGNSVLAKTLYVRGTMYRNVSNTAVINSVRCIWFQDTSNQGSDPTVTDILQSADVRSPLNVDKTSRYSIIRDKVYTLSVGGQAGFNIKKFLPINNHLKYTGSSGSNIYTNALYVLVITDQSTLQPVFDMTSRLAFYDN